MVREQVVTMGGVVQHRRDSGETTESSPLLSTPERPRRPPHRPTLSLTSIASVHVHVPKVHSGRTVVNLLCLIAFVVSSSSGFTSIPVMRILEDIVCRQHYGLLEDVGGPVDEKLCKGDAIQAKVAFIMAIQSSLDAAVGFLAAFPWGLLADRYALRRFPDGQAVLTNSNRIGRKPVFSISLCGILISTLWQMTVVYFHTAIPIQLLWLGSAGLLIGGGVAVLLGIILSMITDSTTEEERSVSRQWFII